MITYRTEVRSPPASKNPPTKVGGFFGDPKGTSLEPVCRGIAGLDEVFRYGDGLTFSTKPA